MLFVVGQLVAGALLYGQLPARVVTHWAGTTDPGAALPRLLVVVGMPMFTLAAFGFLLVAPRLNPSHATSESFWWIYEWFAVTVAGLLTYVQTVVLAANLGHVVPLSTALPPALGIVWISLGSVVGRAEPDWVVSLRVPWLLPDGEPWEVTHRVGGWLLRGAGVVSALAARTEYGLLVAFVSPVVATLLTLAYSHRRWG
ncbi:SdpI family protein [Halospeciosus flavus]|uniref:SdpI family protein n=1 Tax=Halospeciosus flavus TaxID=3032283 RepID=UPI00361A8811